MSTFNGIVAEFPSIRVDFFRSHPDLSPPLACFLSHVHSDHLAGLESLRSPFVYCSAATKEILLRLERFPCRINYAKGILEARVQRYKHLKSLLKPLPLETPTVLELSPGNKIRVTLFDANHCPGAVMFLFEGPNTAVLYTGDIRSEPWFVNAIARSPSMIEYSLGLKTLDTIYLDTSFLEDISFQTKAEGIRELLEKVSEYPPDTLFHLQAWTYGYENVWIALAKALDTKVHVDDYKMSIYGSLVAKDSSNKFGSQFHISPEAAALVGFICGNSYHPGCLTLDENVRLHSCEKGNYCQVIQKGPVVWIQPVITHLSDGHNIEEVGVGGGGDDFERDAELDYITQADVDWLLEMACEAEGIPDELGEEIRRVVLSAVASGRKISLNLEMSSFGENNETAIINAINSIVKKSHLGLGKRRSPNENSKDLLPKTITFPYSRHSSYPELCGLLEVLKPRDVWPCTVSIPEWIDKGITIQGLFGQYCSGTAFRHDKLTENGARSKPKPMADGDSQAKSSSVELSIPHDSPYPDRSGTTPAPGVAGRTAGQSASQLLCVDSSGHLLGFGFTGPHNYSLEDYDEFMQSFPTAEEQAIAYLRQSDPDLSDQALGARLWAYQTVLRNARNKTDWGIGLLSTTDNHTEPEPDLGVME
ncbi:beta-lactamase-like protein [Podospora appendiculata]|uniref:Beta-lactamase-like protein n=1 Tax=Podospora appendiculata TaxID=314037 RepID=A0AAE0XF96_9PEZI|nr:beta-lactamase-like protein [Podospora appendiculata]